MNCLRGACQCCSRSRDRSRERRRITVGGGDAFCDNTVISSKYNVLTFLPLNLLEQFHRPINFYFLVVASVQFIPSIAPVSPYTTLAPLLVAFLISACREGYDDLVRHRQDNASNARLYRAVNLSTGEGTDVPSKKIRVGDLLLLRPLDIVPCDVILLLSSAQHGEVYLSTENLDGETGAKERLSILHDLYNRDGLTSVWSEESTAGANALLSAVRFIKSRSVVIDSEGPNPNLHAYAGTACVASENGQGEPSVIGISIENVALASSVIRSSRHALGIVIFTGNETKVAMTRQSPPVKWADIDKKYNEMTILIFILQVILLFLFATLSCVRLRRAEGSMWYLGLTSRPVQPIEYFLVVPLRFFSMLTPMVPLSFKTMVDISKVYISKIIAWDEELSHHGVGATVNNSALAEDLGRIQYVLTDKTGTLTRNVMLFKYLMDAEGRVYGRSAGRLPHVRQRLYQDGQQLYTNLLRCMVFCNTLERTPSSVFESRVESKAAGSAIGQWISSSPDELALVDGASQFGLTLLERTRNSAFARVRGEAVESVKILRVLKFSSERGRMSVLVELVGNDATEILLLAKGSDERMFPLCTPKSFDAVSVANALDELSCRGLRTLVYGYRVVEKEAVSQWLDTLARAEAISTPEERRKAVAEVYESVEVDLTYCGITAVEDEIQEKTAETIMQLRKAGVRVWMLTGDKGQTARQIAIASGLLTADDSVVNLTPEDYTTSSVKSHIDYVRKRVDYLKRKRNVVEGERRRERRWSHLYQVCGLRQFVHEFTRPFVSARVLNPVCHPLREKLRVGGGSDTPDFTRASNLGSPSSSALDSTFLGNIQEAHLPDFEVVASALYADEEFKEEHTHDQSMTCEISLTQCVKEPLLHTGKRGHCAAPKAGGHAGPTVFGTFPKPNGYSINVAGSTIQLLHLPEHKELLRDFQTVLLYASTVVCSRTTPDQKAFIVKTVNNAGKVTLAIGDGGNDVAMLQEATVGVGIKGKEGQQAALAADFAIAQFRFLSKLMLVHGHVAFQRSSMLVQQSFWKTVVIAWVQLMYNIYTDFSGVSYWSSFSLTMYNSIFTVPVTFLSVLNVPLSPWMLLNNPRLYQISQQGRYLNAVTFYGYVGRGIMQATLMLFIAVGIQSASGGGSTEGRGRPNVDDFDAYLATYFSVVTLNTFINAIESHTISFMQWVCYVFSVVSMVGAFVAWSAGSSGPEAGSFQESLRSPLFYFSWTLITAVPAVSLAMYAAVKLTYFPDVLQLQRLFVKHISTELPVTHILRNLFQDDNPSRLLLSLCPISWMLSDPKPVPYYSIGEEYLNESSVDTPFDKLSHSALSEHTPRQCRSRTVGPCLSSAATPRPQCMEEDSASNFSQPFMKRSRSLSVI